MKSFKNGWSRGVWGVGLVASLLGSAQADKLGISPVIMQINSQRQLSTVTTLSNKGDEAVEFSAELLRWTQQDGKEVTVPTRDALVNPPRFTIQPGRTQVVRVGLRLRPSQPEVTYRLVLRQIPRPKKPTVGGEGVTASITPNYVFSLPLFVSQPSAQSRLKASLERGPQGTLTLVLVNSGTAYGAYRNMVLEVDGKKTGLGGTYVLAGSTVRVALPRQEDSVAKLTLRYQDAQQQEQNESLDIPKP